MMHYDPKRKCNVAVGTSEQSLTMEDLIMSAKLGIIPDREGHIHRDPKLAEKLEFMAKDYIQQFGEECAYGHVVRSNDRIAMMHEKESAKVAKVKEERTKELSKYL